MYNSKTKINVSEGQRYNHVFVKVEASRLRLDDEFMKYEPKKEKARDFKELVKNVINNGMKDFWRPSYDPSFNDDKTGIEYSRERWPATGRTQKWWEETAREFYPERRSRLGTKNEYIAFMAVLIKKLVASGKSVEWAWNAVCIDSGELGKYREEDKTVSYYCTNRELVKTGSRTICGCFCDLANTYKILAEDKELGGWWLAGGVCHRFSLECPLAGVYHHHLYSTLKQPEHFKYCTGWIVLEE